MCGRKCLRLSRRGSHIVGSAGCAGREEDIYYLRPQNAGHSGLRVCVILSLCKRQGKRFCSLRFKNIGLCSTDTLTIQEVVTTVRYDTLPFYDVATCLAIVGGCVASRSRQIHHQCEKV